MGEGRCSNKNYSWHENAHMYVCMYVCMYDIVCMYVCMKMRCILVRDMLYSCSLFVIIVILVAWVG